MLKNLIETEYQLVGGVGTLGNLLYHGMGTWFKLPENQSLKLISREL